MPLFRLSTEATFPPPALAEPSGLLAVGGDLRPERLIAAYQAGIFPWYSEGQPILWHSPDPRFILPLADFRVSRSLKKSRRRYPVTFDQAFGAVIDACAQIPRADQSGTWILPEMKEAYLRLFELGLAHSVEAWFEGALVGGIYGVSLGAAFFGESMFHLRRDASKVALWALIERLLAWDFEVLDCQVPTEHLERLGAKKCPRERFLRLLDHALLTPTRQGPWGG